MAPHEKYNFKSLLELNEKIHSLKLGISSSTDISTLLQSIKIGQFTIPNRLVIHPMEGCDGTLDGAPGELTYRRYHRFGKSGAGLLWFEANAIEQSGRANPHQLMLTDSNKQQFHDLVTNTEADERELFNQHPSFGKSLKILQITHSGRYSRPGVVNPLRMYYWDPLDTGYGQSRHDGRVLSDSELDQLPEKYDHAIGLAKEVGFDGVDIKMCHRYLLSESLSAFNRTNSPYGGEDFEARTKLIKNIFERIINKYASPRFLITTRFNMYDGYPYPYGWGTLHQTAPNAENFNALDTPAIPDLQEPIELLKWMYEKGVRLVNLTIANPYYNSFVSRPYDLPVPGFKTPDEHPLEGITRFLKLTREVRKSLPKDMILIGTGYTWLREYSPNVAAAEVAQQHVDLVGFGRMAFANPEFPKQIILNGKIDPKKVCITCSKCTEMMRKKTVAGCVIRDGETYMPYYKGDKKL